jgi:beta-ribofuranosylaminobenzene 5'-phosphate synthase
MTSPSAFRVVAPTRLHFGLLAIGEGAGASGGAGAMLSEPSLVLSIRPADRFAAAGLHADRIAAFANRWAAGRGERLPAVEICGETAPDQHVGLGLGTQLALATALSLDRVTGRLDSDPETLAALVGRGGRSGIGARGFFLGGFLAEDEKRDGDSLAPLRKHLPFPASWRFVLVRQMGEAGAHGASEDRFFRSLPPTPRDVTERMRTRLFEELVPAVERADFDAFVESAYRFGRESGELFRGAQAGAYASEFAERLVKTLRHRGIRGVGQSSWGPTLWIAAPDPQAAEALAADLRSEHRSANVDVTVATPSSCGVRVESTSDPTSFQDRPDEALSGLRQDA